MHLSLVLVVSALAAASGENCVADDRISAITESELLGRTNVVKLSKDGMWKLQQLAQETPEEDLEDCGTCSEAEVFAALPSAGLTNLTDVFYPFPAGSKELKKNIRSNLEVRTNLKVQGFQALDSAKAKKLAENKNDIKKVTPLGLGKLFEKVSEESAEQSQYKTSSTMKLAEFFTQQKLLSSIEARPDGLVLVLQDGTMVEQNFQEKFAELIARVPKDFDVITLHDDSSMALRCEDRVADKVYEMRRPIRTPDGKGEYYRGVEAYIVRKQSIPKILNEWKMLKADALDTMLMSVHTEAAEKNNANGKMLYTSTGIYSYTACGSGLIHRFEGNSKQDKFLQK